MKKNFLISTGGSGGHVIPATILYEHLSKSANVILSIDKRGFKYIDKNFYPIEIIDTPKLNNIFYSPFNFILILFLIFKSFFVLKKRKISEIISTGGYMSLPLITAGRILNLNIYLVEPNHVLGRANRFFLRSCKKVFCYTDQIKNYPNKFKDKMVIINPLVSEQIYKCKSNVNDKKRFNILIVGGSQSASIFNDNLKESIVKLSKKKLIKVFQQTNAKNILSLKDFYSKNNVENNIFSFEKNFDKILNQVDLCITRAGASTLAELSVLNVPFIAVPLPTSKDNHQFENAKFYEDKNTCWLIEQHSFEEKIDEYLKDIFEKKSDYLEKKENLKKLNFQNTWINVNQKILKVFNEN